MMVYLICQCRSWIKSADHASTGGIECFAVKIVFVLREAASFLGAVDVAMMHAFLH